MAEHLRALPGVEKAAVASSTLLRGWSWNNFISVNGAPVNGVLAYMLSASPGWIETMRIPLLAGRDFRPNDTYPGFAIVNQTFAKAYFNGENPVGKSFDVVLGEGPRLHFAVVGLVGDVRYRDMREPILPQAYFPFRAVRCQRCTRGQGFRHIHACARPAANPMAMASILRREVSRARPGFRVSNIRTQTEINESHTLRERLLARLALFFGLVALLLAGVGLYGVLDYSVLQRRHEIGIRMALGRARRATLPASVTTEVFFMVLAGALAGLALGMAAARDTSSRCSTR